MFELARAIISTAMSDLAMRSTRETRSPGAARVPYTPRTLAGVSVTTDTAPTVSTVWACARYLRNTVAVMPWHVMRVTTKGAEVQPSHPVDYLLSRRPNPEWSSFQFRETLLHWAIFEGNGYAEIETDQLDRPYALWPIHPDRVEACRSATDGFSDAGDEIPAGELYYEVNNGAGPKSIIAAKRMFHLRGFGHGPVGVNLLHYAAQSIGWARAAQLFGATFFGNGGNVATVVINKTKIGPDGLKLQKAEFEQVHTGIRNAHKTVHLGGDGDVKRLGLNAAESQLIEVHQHLVEEICRWFGVPPHKAGHLQNAHFTNIEHQNNDAIVDGAMPWVKRFEDEADAKMFGQNRSNLYTKMNARALQRGDFKSQNEGLEIARRNGVVTTNEWRGFLDMNKIEGDGGDKYVMQSQYTTLERIGEEPAAPPPSNTPPSDPVEPDDDDVEAHARRQARIDTLRDRCLVQS